MTADSSPPPEEMDQAADLAELTELNRRLSEALAWASQFQAAAEAAAGPRPLATPLVQPPPLPLLPAKTLRKVRGSLMRRLASARAWLVGKTMRQIDVKVLHADLRPLEQLLAAGGAGGGFLCTLRAGSTKDVRDKATKQLVTEVAPESHGLRPTWANLEGSEMSFVTTREEDGLQLRVKVMRGGFWGKQVVALAEVGVPLGRHCHQVPLLCALGRGEGISGLLSLTLETNVQLMQRSPDGSCSVVDQAARNGSAVLCEICAGDAAAGDALRLRPCGHGWFCLECVRRWAATQVADGQCLLCCPIPECRRPIEHSQLRTVLPGDAFEGLVRRSVESLCAQDESVVACPTPDCPYRAWVGEGQEPRLVCEYCRLESCTRCGASPYHHGLSCAEEARRQELSQGAAERAARRIEEVLRHALVRSCPGCRAPIERTDACVHMTCPGCRYEFSWVCGHDWALCREGHRCTRRGIYLPELLGPFGRHPALTGLEQPPPVVDERAFEEETASDFFLELRCIYLLSKLRLEVPAAVWDDLRRERPDLLQRVIRGRRSIQWAAVGDAGLLHRMRRFLPEAFPELSLER